MKLKLPSFLGILSFISIRYQFNLHDQFFLVFFKTKLLMINLKMEHCGAFYDPSCHMLRIKKKQWKISNYSINFFKINLSFCVVIYFASWCMYWIIAYFYILDIIYIKDKISVTLLHVAANYANWIFSIHFVSKFNHLNSINFLFSKFYNSMEHLRLHFFIKKPSYIQWY